MGIRGELFSTRVALQNRTYFFNVKENRVGDLYLNIVESKNKDSGGFDRQSVVLFADDLAEFLSGFDESLRALEKAARDKKRGSAPRTAFRGGTEEEAPARPRPPGERTGKTRFVKTSKATVRTTKPGAGGKRQEGASPAKKGGRVVVKRTGKGRPPT